MSLQFLQFFDINPYIDFACDTGMVGKFGESSASQDLLRQALT
jgi:hypothetical protein